MVTAKTLAVRLANALTPAAVPAGAREPDPGRDVESSLLSGRQAGERSGFKRGVEDRTFALRAFEQRSQTSTTRPNVLLELLEQLRQTEEVDS